MTRPTNQPSKASCGGSGKCTADSPEHREREQGADIRGRSKDAPALWAAQRKYEGKHEKAEVRADEEMDVGV